MQPESSALMAINKRTIFFMFVSPSLIVQGLMVSRFGLVVCALADKDG
jgi:hypothetical protein